MPIRKLQKTDINRVAEIWLTANRNAHAFIPAAYWESHLDFVKEKKTKLSLNVYQKNTRAIRFYQREGFQIQCEGLDEATGEKDYEMVWKRE